MTSSAATIEQGGSAPVVFSISGITTPLVATYNAEVAFDAANLDIACGVANCGCVIDPRLTDQSLQVTRPTTGSLIFFVGDTSNPVGSFGDGAMFTCTFSAPTSGTTGVYTLDSTFLEVGDALGNVLAANAEYGDLTVIIPPPTPTNTATAVPTSTSAATATHTATIAPTRTNTPVNTATRTVTETPSASGDDGCNMNPNAGSMSLWLLLPLAVLPLARQRNRGR